MAETKSLPSIEQYLADNPNADPKTMLQVVLEKTALMREENEFRNMEYRAATEVEMDQHFNFKPKTLAQLYRLARMYAESGYVPDHYKNNIPNTAIAIQMALRCRVDIMTFLQASYIVYGKPGIEGKLVTAIMNASSAIEGRVDFEYKRNASGKIIACRAYAYDAKTTKELSQEVTWEMVEAEGWHEPKKGQKSKWVTLPDVMFAYRSATFLARVHFPDVLMGMHTVDELEDTGETVAAAGPTAAAAAELQDLSERMGAAPAPPPKATRKRATAAGGLPATESTSDPEATRDPPAETKSEPAEPTTPTPTTTPPVRERAAWLGMQDEAAAAAEAGKWDLAERKYREAAGNHPSNDPDNSKVISLLKRAEDCRAEHVQPAPAETTTTKRSPAPPASAATPGPAGAPTAPKAAAAAGAGTVGAPRKGWTPESCRQYLTAKHPVEMVNYDVDRLCEVAANQGAPQIYLDNMMSRTNPNWHKFTAAPAAEPAAEPTGPVGGEWKEGSGNVLTDAQLDEIDKREPIAKPPMFSSDGLHFERQILGYKQPKRVDNLIANDIEPSESLTNDEVAYLKFIARQKKRELSGQAPLQGSQANGNLPGMG